MSDVLLAAGMTQFDHGRMRKRLFQALLFADKDVGWEALVRYNRRGGVVGPTPVSSICCLFKCGLAKRSCDSYGGVQLGARRKSLLYSGGYIPIPAFDIGVPTHGLLLYYASAQPLISFLWSKYLTFHHINLPWRTR